MKRVFIALALFAYSQAAGAQIVLADNPEMNAIALEDQAVRSQGGAIDWSVVGPQDAERRRQTRTLLESGALVTGRDFSAAALVFQHGDKPEDFLLGHVLATRAIALGDVTAEWLAAATLDRYLQNIGRKQVYGTQFSMSAEGGATMEPYDKELLTDAVRKAAGAHTLAEQEAQLPEMEKLIKGLAGPPE